MSDWTSKHYSNQEGGECLGGGGGGGDVAAEGVNECIAEGFVNE